jgi:prepilin-type N-terminal cleavage/methylation domain-containing protein
MHRGFSLIELLIVAAVMSLFFGGLFLTMQASLKLIADSRARMSALSVANDRLEYIRSLPYDAVGTVSGLPSGAIPQVSTTTLNGYLLTERTLVEYIDDPADGLGGADSNAITTDFKRVKIEISWTLREATQTVVLVSNIVPRSIETNVGGGTIRVNVTDANVLPLAGASVRLLNTTGTTTVDVTKFTDATGVVLFGGAPAGSGYEVFVSRVGYSSAQTHQATGTLANPTLLPVSLIAADVSTVDLQIDSLATVDVTLLTNQVEVDTALDFASTTDIATSSDVTIDAEALVLASTAGVYVPTGQAMTQPFAPTPLARWQEIVVEESHPLATTRVVRLYASTSLASLIPDSDLPGNAVGFATDRIDISDLDASTYPELVLGITLETTDTATTTRIDAITVHSVESETPLATNFSWHGNKIIGTQADFSPVYKHSYATTTNVSGYRQLSNVEWDTYYLTTSGYDIEESCPVYPLAVAPGGTPDFRLIMAADTANSLRVVVTASGQPVRNATVTLTKSGSTVKTTSGCGQAFFGGVTAEPDYVLTVSAPGYSPVTVDPLSVTGDVVEEIAL